MVSKFHATLPSLRSPDFVLAPHPVPDPHRGTKGTCLGPRASAGPAGPSGGAFRYRKKEGEEEGKKEILGKEKK